MPLNKGKLHIENGFFIGDNNRHSNLAQCEKGVQNMTKVNQNFLKLPGSYLFSEVARRISAYSAAHPDAKIIKLSIGDVTRPWPPR